MSIGWVSRDGRHLALGVRHLGTASEPSQEISLTQCMPGVEARLGGETIHLGGARGSALALRISVSLESLCGCGGFFSRRRGGGEIEGGNTLEFHDVLKFLQY